jgi:Cu-Zn family superoxide dismutase
MKILQLAGIFIVAVSVAAFSPSARSQSKSVTFEIRNAEGHNIGTAALSPTPTGVRIKLDIKALPPGQHSIHIHQFAKCDPPDFKTAGPHFGAAHADHEHSPAGDIPDFSLIVAADGTANVSVVAPNVTMGSEDNSVFSNGGTSIVIHAVTDPSASGAPARIACGVISKP